MLRCGRRTVVVKAEPYNNLARPNDKNAATSRIYPECGSGHVESSPPLRRPYDPAEGSRTIYAPSHHGVVRVSRLWELMDSAARDATSKLSCSCVVLTEILHEVELLARFRYERASMEAEVLRIYRDTARFISALAPEHRRFGYKILNGPPIPPPTKFKFLSLDISPAAEPRRVEEQGKRSHERWPPKCEYAVENWKLAVQLKNNLRRKLSASMRGHQRALRTMAAHNWCEISTSTPSGARRCTRLFARARCTSKGSGVHSRTLDGACGWPCRVIEAKGHNHNWQTRDGRI